MLWSEYAACHYRTALVHPEPPGNLNQPLTPNSTNAPVLWPINIQTLPIILPSESLTLTQHTLLQTSKTPPLTKRTPQKRHDRSHQTEPSEPSAAQPGDRDLAGAEPSGSEQLASAPHPSTLAEDPRFAIAPTPRLRHPGPPTLDPLSPNGPFLRLRPDRWTAWGWGPCSRVLWLCAAFTACAELGFRKLLFFGVVGFGL